MHADCLTVQVICANCSPSDASSVDLCTDSLTLGGCIHSAQPREYRKMTRMLLVALLT